eukprot:10650201-Alexandrium_andersonii.AAC.1
MVVKGDCTELKAECDAYCADQATASAEIVAMDKWCWMRLGTMLFGAIEAEAGKSSAPSKRPASASDAAEAKKGRKDG